MQSPEITVIISTYNQPDWLGKVLFGYDCQSINNFQVIVADDGSAEDTKKLIQEFSKTVKYSLKHIWHEDQGFRKTVILNKAIVVADSDYLLFTDGDCIPREDFIETHLRMRKSGWFLSGGYFKLPKDISELISEKHIRNQECFDVDWLINKGLESSFKLNKLTAEGRKERFLNFITPTKATWDGMNVSGWKKDVMLVNGFDERMQYGGEDREIGERLFNLGIKAKQVRYSAVCIHLHHERSYVHPEMITKNKAIRKVTKRDNVIRTPFGIEKD
ncbi:Glycosyltransferase involved in cell wall bisynthesis [Aquimarina amphilecti]|uniref:Glycosyltransferase involved in cell wall bisynthesis n=1 Tax=Aquimarina amphilecti TaxID=1038014 RepID=A0A1H7PSF5_AQUAM|nr:glycosyltransferase family 2 protein [Aquimarina amphilecti]SEL38398.1 Glycosyltransferase involved in cell wall bisynthesis [Aquimarina amphilecti]